MSASANSVSTHVLDAAAGTPAAGVNVTLFAASGVELARARTDGDGRVAQLAADLEPGIHRLRFDTAEYFAGLGVPAFYPEVVVAFDLGVRGGHHHIPLLLSPFAYSTYRGS
ncbi:hydroxyisourate hydrolase [Mycolicibacterium sp. BiH015]|uniref:hydroxyisourate hydrolase n=1 Tax=Mycolicibacterium sp. BiH015 TaxID=3018808 RepID=UPI0022E7B6B2|nr:hydroxyisourate hydrolase [Mycolicibacterium sp. BiH015]MDA2892239.1 hydroxyisourate hydrolase [Mycolicibacterium sp. BiH015]